MSGGLGSAIRLALRGYRPRRGGIIHRSVERVGVVEIGRGVRLHKGVVLDAGFGGAIRLGDGVSLCLGTQLATAGGDIEFFEGAFANAYCVILSAGPVRVGRSVMMGPRVTIAAGSHRHDGREPISGQPITGLGVTIGPDAWICAAATILDGVTVGEGTVVAAGAVVTRDTPPFSVVAGIPARVVRYRRPEDAVDKESVVR
jgi:acetyltransferase-like isoleucine patch superfamily enzyme